MTVGQQGSGLLATVPAWLIIFDVLRPGRDHLMGSPYVLLRAQREYLRLYIPRTVQVFAFPSDAATLLAASRDQRDPLKSRGPTSGQRGAGREQGVELLFAAGQDDGQLTGMAFMIPCASVICWYRQLSRCWPRSDRARQMCASVMFGPSPASGSRCMSWAQSPSSKRSMRTRPATAAELIMSLIDRFPGSHAECGGTDLTNNPRCPRYWAYRGQREHGEPGVICYREVAGFGQRPVAALPALCLAPALSTASPCFSSASFVFHPLILTCLSSGCKKEGTQTKRIGAAASPKRRLA